jgi:hypothetical protein
MGDLLWPQGDYGSQQQDRFNAAISGTPSAMPNPDGMQHILNASQAMNATRKETQRAFDRLNEYLSTGIVPEDLKR